MIATVINAAAVIVGSIIGLVLHAHIRDSFKTVVFTGIGVVTLILGLSMALETQRVLYLALALVIGGILGNWWNIEGGILRLGDYLKSRFASQSEDERDFAYGFLTASVLFCVGALAIVGSFRAGAEGNYELILTKSVLDGFMSILLAAAMGVGVAFSALVVFVYQGALTLLSAWLGPLVSPLVLSEITALGGALVIMIGINLLEFKQIKTANYIPSLVIVLLFVALDPFIGAFVTV